jgi:hypothetical protein
VNYKTRYFVGGIEVSREDYKKQTECPDKQLVPKSLSCKCSLSDIPNIKTFTRGQSVVSVLDTDDPLLQLGLHGAELNIEDTAIIIQEPSGGPRDPLSDRRYTFIYDYKWWEK